MKRTALAIIFFTTYIYTLQAQEEFKRNGIKISYQYLNVTSNSDYLTYPYGHGVNVAYVRTKHMSDRLFLDYGLGFHLHTIRENNTIQGTLIQDDISSFGNNLNVCVGLKLNEKLALATGYSYMYYYDFLENTHNLNLGVYYLCNNGNKFAFNFYMPINKKEYHYYSHSDMEYKMIETRVLIADFSYTISF